MSAVPLTSATPASDRVTDSDAHATHSDYAVHPEAVRLRAVTLWCEGLRFPAISKQLGVPERTIRAWLADARADFHSDQGETAHERIALAVERQLAIAAAAWTSYHHAVELEQLALDYYRAGLNRTAALKNIEDELPPPPPRPSTAPAASLHCPRPLPRRCPRRPARSRSPLRLLRRGHRRCGRPTRRHASCHTTVLRANFGKNGNCSLCSNLDNNGIRHRR